MKALVTGCAGFIGSHLTDKLLAEGYEVFGIDSFTDYYPRILKEKNISSARQNTRFHLIENDIVNIVNFPEVDYVFHLAAQAGVRSSWGSTFNIYLHNNIAATQALLEYYKEKNIKKFVYASSSSVYGDTELPMRENNILRPVSPYGVTKLAGEHLCYLYYKNYRVPSISLRYFTVYGPRLRPDLAISKFTKAINNNDEITVYGDGSQTRDFTFVDDVVMANILAANSEYSGESYNIGGGNRITVNELISIIEKSTKQKANLTYVDKQKGDVENTMADNSKAKNMLNWTPKTNITIGIPKYIEWYNNNMYKN